MVFISLKRFKNQLAPVLERGRLVPSPGVCWMTVGASPYVINETIIQGDVSWRGRYHAP